MKHFIHSGDLGDVIYSLPTVKAMGGGKLILADVPGIRTMHGMTRERREAITPLLAAQPYVHGVYGPFDLMPTDEGEASIDLNEFRRRGRDLVNEWLPNHYLDVHGVDRAAAFSPWLTTSDFLGCPIGVVIARSARYHNPHFPWRRVLDQYGQHAVFCGTPAEHAAFNAEFGSDLIHVATDDLLEVADLIQASMLFIGNQSCPLAIAEGLKKPIVCEVCHACPNCNSPRHDFITGQDENVRLPDLEELLHAI